MNIVSFFVNTLQLILTQKLVGPNKKRFLLSERKESYCELSKAFSTDQDDLFQF